MTPRVDEPALSLAAEFGAPDEAAWRSAVDRVLARGKGELDTAALEALFRKSLVTDTDDGLEIQPLYTQTPSGTAGVGLPGFAPFVRGGAPLGHRANGWDVRQRVVVAGEPSAVAARVLEELERGATSIVLELTGAGEITVDLLDACLDGVFLDLVPVVLDAGDRADEAAGALIALWERRGITSAAAQAVLGLDPVGRWLRAGGATDLSATTSAATSRAATQTGAPGVRSIVVDAALVHEAGGGEIEELGYAVAAGIHYLRELTAAGLSVDEAAAQLEFRFAATPDQFLTIAKLRAARRLWQRAADVSGVAVAGQRQQQHAVSSRAASSRYDIWVNLLRATVGCFGAGVGGADAVTVIPHDDLVVPGGSDVARRMARNTQLILVEESNAARVVDMAGGSYYVEDLTDQLARAGWEFFREIERSSGLVPAALNGLVQARVAEVAARRDAEVAHRMHPLTGVSEFPDINEAAPPAIVAVDKLEGAVFQALQPRRHADPIEEQRGRADRIEATTGKRPEIFLATLGTPAVHTARATFAKNFFEAGGIRAVIGSGYDTAADALAAFTASGARLVCLCSDDATYATLATETAAALSAANPDRLYLAGRPKGLDVDLKEAGVDEQLVAGGDLLVTLTTALDILEGSVSA